MEELESSLNTARLDAALQELESQNVALTVPRFSYDLRVSLAKTLAETGSPARVEELSQARRNLPVEERTEDCLQSLAQARADALRNGTALDFEREAAHGD